MKNKKYIISGLAVAVVGFILWNLDILRIPAFPQQPVMVKPEVGLYSDYPINLQIENTLMEGSLKITHQVTYDNKENKYRYYYRVHNLGKDLVLFNWEVLDKEKPSFVEIAPNESHESTLLNNKPPIFSKSQALILKKDGKVWYLADRGTSLGPIPSN